jgi:ribosomal protein L37AE/L43A
MDNDLAVESSVEVEAEQAHDRQSYYCDRCGAPMMERNCKVVCFNCGNQFDCSDLTLYFD